MPAVSPLQSLRSKNSSAIKRVQDTLYEDYDPLLLKILVKFLHHRKLFKWFKIFSIILHICGFIYSLHGKFTIMYPQQKISNNVVIFVDCLSQTLLVIANILGLFVFSQSLYLYIDIHNFTKNKSREVEGDRKKFGRCMIVLYLLIYASIAINLYFFIFDIGWSYYQYLVARELELYFFNLLIFTILCFVHKIKDIFQDVNQMLLETDQKYFVLIPQQKVPLEETVLDTQKTSRLLEHLKFITKYHNSICNLLDTYNDYYKAVLVLLVLCLIVNILWDCTILIFVVKNRPNEFEPLLYSYTMYPILIVISAGQAALVALIGEHLSEEGEKTTVLCYNLLNKLPTDLEFKNDQLIEKQLNFLLDQTKSRNISLHAGGFFVLNWGILGSIASTVATYSIVIIQFLLK